jgi:penicillin-binding protein 1A
VLLTHERTFERKARELLLARRIEQELSKDEILELYLNHIYFGHGRYGIQEASRYYFGKDVGDVDLAEAALLAGLPKGPSVYSPRVNPERARRRRDAVLAQIGAKHFAARSEVQRALQEPVVLAMATERLPELAPEAVDEVRRTLRRLVGPAASRGGFTVTTTIDPELQAAARQAVRDNLDAYAKRHHRLAPLKAQKGKQRPAPFQGTPGSKGHSIHWAVVTGADDAKGLLNVRVGTVDGTVKLADAARYNPKTLPPSRFAEKGTLVRVSARLDRGLGSDGVPRHFRLELGPQSAMVAVDVDSRDIVALVGSYEAIRGGLDRSRAAMRQPGSSFKPVVYSYGIHSRRMTAATIIPDEQNELNGSDTDKPPLRLRDGVARSVNRAALWALREVGAASVVAWAQAMGVQSKLGATESLALGAYELTPRELAGVYATFAGAGSYGPLRLISRVVGPDGDEVAMPARPPKRTVMDRDEAFLVTSLLQSVVRYGTGSKAGTLGFDVAGKTGTSNKAKDAWFAGYSSELVCVVWTGFDDAVPLGRRESGAKAALPAFIGFMAKAHKRGKPAAFKRPEGLVRVAIDPATGLLPYEGQEDVIEEWFLPGTEPSEPADVPDAGAGGEAGAAPSEGGGGADAGARGDEPAAATGAGGAAGDARVPRSGAGGAPAAAAASASATTAPTAADDDAPPPF